jgi:glycerol-3-phosphate acyltransferase PlsY
MDMNSIPTMVICWLCILIGYIIGGIVMNFLMTKVSRHDEK